MSRVISAKRQAVKRVFMDADQPPGSRVIIEHKTLQDWLIVHKGKLVRRRNGQQIYIVRGLKRGLDQKIVLDLERFQSGGGRTWAPIDTIDKFILCTTNGTEVTMHPDRDCNPCCDTPAHHDPVAGLADRYDAATLKRALKARRKIDAEAMRIEAEIAAERDENQRLRQVCIKALEKKASSGDVSAAVELHRLVS